MRILYAEDERELSNAVCAILRHNRYSVDAVYDGGDALDYALSGCYDALILDIMMPKRDGLSVLRELRGRGVTLPVLLLTAKGDTPDRIAGLDSGADDYLPKPFDTGELLARLRALVRRQAGFTPTTLSVGNTSLNGATYELSGPSGGARLGNREFQLLELLMRSRGTVVPAERIMERIWGYDSDAEINVVWVYVSYLRKRLAAVGSDCEIRAVRGIGYCLEAPQ